MQIIMLPVPASRNLYRNQIHLPLCLLNHLDGIETFVSEFDGEPHNIVRCARVDGGTPRYRVNIPEVKMYEHPVIHLTRHEDRRITYKAYDAATENVGLEMFDLIHRGIDSGETTVAPSGGSPNPTCFRILRS